MIAERIAGSVLLGVTLVLGIAMLFAPMGEAWVQENGVRTTNEFHFFTKEVETAPAATPDDPSSAATWYYIDDGLATSGGITYLQAMGPLAAVGLFLVAVGLVLTAVPRTSPTRAGGLVALPGALLLFVSVVMAVVGIPMHAADQVARTAQVDWNGASAGLAVLTVFLGVLASGMGITRARAVAAEPGMEAEEDWSAPDESGAFEDPYGADEAAGYDEPYEDEGAYGAGDEPLHAEHHEETPWEDEPEPTPPAAPARTQFLKCPDCATIVEADVGTIPICPDCGFGGDAESGGASPPAGRGTTA